MVNITILGVVDTGSSPVPLNFILKRLCVAELVEGTGFENRGLL